MFLIQVVTDLDGNFIVQIGSSGEEGLNDGSFDDATFNRPQVQNKEAFNSCLIVVFHQYKLILFFCSRALLIMQRKTSFMLQTLKTML